MCGRSTLLPLRDLPLRRANTVTGKWMVSKEGGEVPLWRRDGKELFYLSSTGMAMAVDVQTSGIFQAGIPKPLFKVPRGIVYWDVTSDGKRFLMPVPEASNAAAVHRGAELAGGAEEVKPGDRLGHLM